MRDMDVSADGRSERAPTIPWFPLAGLLLLYCLAGCGEGGDTAIDMAPTMSDEEFERFVAEKRQQILEEDRARLALSARTSEKGRAHGSNEDGRDASNGYEFNVATDDKGADVLIVTYKRGGQTRMYTPDEETLTMRNQWPIGRWCLNLPHGKVNGEIVDNHYKEYWIKPDGTLRQSYFAKIKDERRKDTLVAEGTWRLRGSLEGTFRFR